MYGEMGNRWTLKEDGEGMHVRYIAGEREREERYIAGERKEREEEIVQERSKNKKGKQKRGIVESLTMVGW